jgi:hypothetical protein
MGVTKGLKLVSKKEEMTDSTKVHSKAYSKDKLKDFDLVFP